MVRQFFVYFITIICLCSVWLVHANEKQFISLGIVYDKDEQSEQSTKLNRLDHKNNVIVVGDFLYRLPLNVKVYKSRGDSSKLRSVNRYALERGQKVSVVARQSGKITYADKIFIFK